MADTPMLSRKKKNYIYIYIWQTFLHFSIITSSSPNTPTGHSEDKPEQSMPKNPCKIQKFGAKELRLRSFQFITGRENPDKGFRGF